MCARICLVLLAVHQLVLESSDRVRINFVLQKNAKNV